MKQVPQKLLHIGNNVLTQLFSVIRSNLSANVVQNQVDFSLWHKRLGQASESKLRHINMVPKARKCMEEFNLSNGQVCQITL